MALPTVWPQRPLHRHGRNLNVCIKSPQAGLGGGTLQPGNAPANGPSPPLSQRCNGLRVCWALAASLSDVER